MNRRAFLAALGAALLAGPTALASLIARHRRPWYEGVRLVKRMEPVEMSGEVVRRLRYGPAFTQWADHELAIASRRLRLEVDRMYFGDGGIPRGLLAWRPPVRSRGSFVEFERRVRAMGFGS